MLFQIYVIWRKKAKQLKENVDSIRNHERLDQMDNSWLQKASISVHRCDDDSQPNKVMFYLAEKLVYLDGCDVGLCDWEYFRQKFSSVISRCNLNVCWNGSGTTVFVPNFLLLLLSLVSLVFLKK